MSTQTFSGIKKITVYCNCIVEGDGTLDTDAEEVTKQGDELIVGSANRGGSAVSNFMSFGNGTIVSGGYSSMNMNGIDISSSNGTIELRGPAGTRLTVNGVKTTFGAVKSGGSGLALAAPKKTYCLDDTCSINHLVVAGKATRPVDLAPAFVDEDFVVTVSGAGDVQLPAMIFERLGVSVAGAGNVTGRAETKAKTLSITIAGAGDCNGITALGEAMVKIMGAGDVTLFAVDKRLVTKQVRGAGRVNVRDALEPPKQKTVSAFVISRTLPVVCAAKPAEKRSHSESAKKKKVDDGKVIKKRRDKEPLESAHPTQTPRVVAVAEEPEDPDAWILPADAQLFEFENPENWTFDDVDF